MLNFISASKLIFVWVLEKCNSYKDKGLMMRIESIIQTENSTSVQTPKSIIPFKGKDIKSDESEDVFEVSENAKSYLSAEDKQLILHKSKVVSSGWSAFFGGFSTLYYFFRSNYTIAEYFDLDQRKDIDLIKDIKKQQTIATLPAAAGNLFFGVGSLASGGLAWLYFKYIEDPYNQVI